MTRIFSAFVLAILQTGALGCVVLLFSGLGLARNVVTARATIPFEFWGGKAGSFNLGSSNERCRDT
jgi:hypothetical protein